MPGLKDTFVTGWQRSLNLSLLLPLYVTSLLFGLMQTWPLWTHGDLMTNPQLDYLAAGGVDAWVNLLLGNREVQTQTGATAMTWVLISQVLLALYSLAYNFFTGGILTVWAGTRPFWAGCRYTFWTFAGLGLLLLILVSPVALITVIAASILGPGALVPGVVLLLLFNLLGEYARSMAVTRNEANPFKLIGSAFIFSLRHFGGVLSLGGLGTALHAGVAVLYLTVGPLISGTVALVLVQQVIVLLWLWVKLLRLAWALRYVQTTYETQQLSAQAELVGVVRLVTKLYLSRPLSELGELAKQLPAQDNLVAVLAGYDGQKLTLVISCAEGTGISARELLAHYLAQIAGKGGGDARLAQGGGKATPEQVEQVWAQTRAFLKEKLLTRGLQDGTLPLP